MLHMTKRIHMRQVEAAAPIKKSVWPLIIFGAAAGVTWSWFDPDGADKAAVESVRVVQVLAQQGIDVISANMKQLLANNSI